MKRIIMLACLCSFVFADELPERLIAVDFNAEKGNLSLNSNTVVGAGRANEGLRADWQEQLVEVKKDCDFKYIRFHGIFHDDMAVYRVDEKGNEHYNFQYVDKLYDFLLSIGIKPFVEMSFMPKDMASGEKTVFWWKGNVTPPKDINKWGELVEKFVTHLTERYGEEEVKTWYFEVWNEPDHHSFFTGTRDDYFAMYKISAEKIKAICPEYRVGGPATAGSSWHTPFLTFCKENQLPVDFLAAHAYGVSGFLDEFGDKQLKLVASHDLIARYAKNSRSRVDKIYPGLEIHYTEWGASYSSRDPVHDSYISAPYMMNSAKLTEGFATTMSYWVFTDIFEETCPPPTPFHGGFGLMNLNGIKKPQYFVYQYLNMLGDIELINQDANSWVCKDKDGGIQLLAYDLTFFDQDKAANQTFYKQYLPSKGKAVLKVSLENVPNGVYDCQFRKVGYRANDAFTIYKDMGEPDNLSQNQVEIIKSYTTGEPFKRMIVTIKDGTFACSEPMRTNDILFITLDPAK